MTNPTRGVMIVLNDIVRDNRVLKMAAAMRRVYPDFVLIGTFKAREFNLEPRERVINGLRCILFPNYAKAVKYETDYSPARLALMKHKKGIKHFTQDIPKFVKEFAPTCVHTHDMYTLPIGEKIKKDAIRDGRKLTWIHDVHEFALGSSHMPPLLQKYAIQLEEKHIENADIVFTVTDALKDELSKTYKNIKNLGVIFNTPNRYVDGTQDLSTIRKDIGVLDPEQKVTVYAGQVKEKRGVERFVEALPYLPNVHFAVLTNNKGGLVDSIIARAKELDVESRLHWLPYVQPHDVAKYIEDADLGIIPIENYGNAEVALPNKLFDHIFAGLPTISHDLRAINAFFKTYHLGKVVDFDTPAAVAKVVKTALKSKPKRFQRDLRRVEEAYAWEVQEASIMHTYIEARGFKDFKVLNRVTRIKTPKNKLRVFQGITGAAGQPNTLSRALNKLPGIFASSMQITLPKFGYPTDLFYPVTKTDFKTMSAALSTVSDSFDIYHFHTRGFLFDRHNTAFPTGSDLLALKAAGKQVIVHFRGSEARLQSEFVKHNPFNYVEDDAESTVGKFPEAAKRKYIDLAGQVCDAVFVNDPEIQSYVPNSQIIERAIDLSAWKNIGIKKKTNPLVVHAPSRRGVKGTEQVLEAVESLREKGFKFEFKLVEGLKHDEARAIYEKADIIVDQLRIGWYGVLAVEAMALGKPVIAYIRDDLLHTLGDNPPVINANPLTIETELEHLISDFDYRKAMSIRARAFCEKYHSADVVAAKLKKIYKEISANPRPVNTPEVLGHLVSQYEHAQDLYINEIKSRRAFQKAYSKNKARLNQQLIMAAPSFRDRMAFVSKKYNNDGFWGATKYFGGRLIGTDSDKKE